MRLDDGARVAGGVHAEPLLRRAGDRRARASRAERAPAADARARRQHRQRERRHGRAGHRSGARDLRGAGEAARLRASRRCCRSRPASSWSRCRSIASSRDCRVPRAPGADRWARRGRGDHDDRHGAESRVGPLRSRRARDHGHRHRQRRRHDPAEHGDDARLRRDRRAREPGARAARRSRYAAERSFNCITVDGDTSTNDSFVLIATGRADMREITDARERRVRGVPRCGHRRRRAARAGDRPRRRRRDEVHHRARRRRARRARVPPGRLRDRAFAAREDRVLRVRPEPRAHTGRGGLRRHRRSRREQGRSLSGRRAASRRAAGAMRRYEEATASAS